MEFNEIISLMQEMNKTGLTKIKIERDDFKLQLEKNIGVNNGTTIMSNHNLEQAVSVSSKPVQALTPKQEAENTKVNEGMASFAVANDVIANDHLVKELPGTKKILSPMVGTFYGQPAPDKPSFTSVGDAVKKGQTVCIIEAMKLMNEIESEVEGEIVECLVENEDMVEFGQPLFVVK